MSDQLILQSLRLQQRPVQAMPQRQPQPAYQRPAQPVNARQQVPSSQNQAVLRRDAQPYAQPVMQPVPQRLQIPQQPRPVNQAMPVLHTSTQQLNTRMPVPHRPAQSPNANMPVVRSVPQTIAMPRHVSNPGEERRELESLMEEEQYDELQEDGIVEADSEFEEFDDDEEEEVVEKKHRRISSLLRIRSKQDLQQTSRCSLQAMRGSLNMYPAILIFPR